MPKASSAASLPPPPPRPDPITLDQIYTSLTTSDVSLQEKAYHLVALSTIVFHPTVKLFLFEYTPLPSASTSGDAEGGAGTTGGAVSDTEMGKINAANQLRREGVLKQVAFFLAQRNNAVCVECRWETIALLGELCRLENAFAGAPTTAQGLLEAKLNGYAKANLEYLARLPWFGPAVQSILMAAGKAMQTAAEDEARKAITGSSSNEIHQRGGTGSSGSSSSNGTSRDALRQRVREAAQRARENSTTGGDTGNSDDAETDEDVLIALQDVMRALPTLRESTPGAGDKVAHFSHENLEQAHDLMFLDASTSLLHLIPMVTRSSSVRCAQCRTPQTDPAQPLLRCSSCKAVYYCSPECQKQHWTTAHRSPCKAYKERCDTILTQYYAANSTSSRKQKKDAKKGEVVILEVPLEPTLFFETRRYLYDHRDSSFESASYPDYFMKYTVRGS